MIQLFPVTQGDVSVKYLSVILGNMGGILPGAGGKVLLGEMFRFFNSSVLVVAVLGIIYITVVGLLKTAHEGEVMGKQWNNMWLPIRALLGISLLVPTTSGYCAIQYLIVWIVVQGIGAADGLWNRAIDFTKEMGSPYTQASTPTMGIIGAFEGLFKGLTCEATAYEKKPNPGNTGGETGQYYCNKNSNFDFCKKGLEPLSDKDNVSTFFIGPNGGDCGKLTYCNEKVSCKYGQKMLSCMACQTQRGFLREYIPSLRAVAKDLQDADYSYRDFYANSKTITGSSNSSWRWIYDYCSAKGDGQATPATCCVKSTTSTYFKLPNQCEVNPSYLFNPNSSPETAPSNVVKEIYWEYWPGLAPGLANTKDFIGIAVNELARRLDQTLKDYIRTLPIDTSWLDEAKDRGWMMAGAYYLKLANMNGQNVNDMIPILEWQDNPNSPMAGYRNNNSAAESLIVAARNKGSQSFVESSPVGSITQGTTNTLGRILGNVGSDNQTNPLIKVQGAGKEMLVTAEVLFWSLIPVITVIGILGFLSFTGLGTGLTNNPVGPVMQTILIFVLPAVYALFAILITLGGLLSVYTPLIPLIFFSFAALGWMIATIEAVVAGPLIALIMISPRGDHELLGNAHQALMHLFDTFIRPSLLIFAFFIAMLVATVAVTFVNAGFSKAIESLNPNSGVIPLLLVTVVWIMIVLATLNKCFAIINELPNQVMRYIGGHGRDAKEPSAEIKGGMQTAASKGSGAVSGAGGAAEKKYRAQASRNAEREAEENKNKPGVSGDK